MFNGTPQSSELAEHPLVPVFTSRQAETGLPNLPTMQPSAIRKFLDSIWLLMQDCNAAAVLIRKPQRLCVGTQPPRLAAGFSAFLGDDLSAAKECPVDDIRVHIRMGKEELLRMILFRGGALSGQGGPHLLLFSGGILLLSFNCNGFPLDPQLHAGR